MKQSVEEHTVITEDGYVLTIHRIPGGPNSKPILVQHGLTGSSMVWLISGGKPLGNLKILKVFTNPKMTNFF